MSKNEISNTKILTILKIDFSENSHDTFFVHLLNLNNFDRSENFLEFKIHPVYSGLGFFYQKRFCPPPPKSEHTLKKFVGPFQNISNNFFFIWFLFGCDNSWNIDFSGNFAQIEVVQIRKIYKKGINELSEKSIFKKLKFRFFDPSSQKWTPKENLT